MRSWIDTVRRSVGVVLLFGMGLAFSSCSLAPHDDAWNDPPFDFILEDTPEIPDGLGMPFFYGEWVQAGVFPMIVTDGVIDSRPAMPREEPYRVLYTADDYVFFVNLVHFSAEEGGDVWTKFGVFVLQDLYNKSRESLSATLRWYSCTDSRMKRAEAFEWSDERLMTIFHDRCGKAAEPGEYLPIRGYFWNSAPYYLEKAY